MAFTLKQFYSYSNLFAVPVVVLEPRTCKMLFCNEFFEELTGFALSDVSGQSIDKLFSEKDRSKIEAVIELSKKNNGFIRIIEKDLEIRRRSGRRNAVDVYCNPIKMGNKKLLVLTLIDLTEIKERQSEKEYLINQNLRSAKLADLGRLAQGIAHELNNPLGIILANIDIIHSDAVNILKIPESIRKQIESISNQSTRMSGIIRKLLNFYKSDEIAFKDVKSVDLIRDVTSEVEPLANFAKIKMYIEVDEFKFCCDPLYIKQVVVNLLKNAISAIEHSQNKKYLKLKFLNNQGEYILSVTNYGPPISEDIKNKIFTPFFTTKDVGESIGLSLYLSEKIMKIHEGSISFESSSKVGTTFFLHFHQKTNLSLSSSPARVLVISSSSVFKNFLISKLEQEGVQSIDIQYINEIKDVLHYPLVALLMDIKTADQIHNKVFQDFLSLNPNFPIVIFYDSNLSLSKDSINTSNEVRYFSKPVLKDDFKEILRLIKAHSTKKVG